MIQTISTSSFGGYRREAQITCDGCGASTALADIGPASTGDSAALAQLRSSAGFVERVGTMRPLDVGQTVIRDLCATCAAKERA